MKKIIIDFDSTFIRIEALDKLAEIAIPHDDDYKNKINQIKAITTAGMNGEIGFEESLAKRLVLVKPKKKHLLSLIKVLHQEVSFSVLENRELFKKYADHIYIISGGFMDYIYPVVKKFGIKKENIVANSFLINSRGEICGHEKDNLLTKNQGKAQAAKMLGLGSEVCMIGDGYTDYEVKLLGGAGEFYAFTENIRRENVVQKADGEFNDFGDLFRAFFQEGKKTLKKPKVLLLENISDQAKNKFEEMGCEVESLPKALAEDELRVAIKDVNFLGIRSKTKISRQVLDSAPELLAIGAFCIGTNQIDLVACASKGVAVFNAPFSSTTSVVELALGEMIMLSRKIFEKSNKLHQGTWDKSASGCHEIKGKKLGIIGYGKIGSQLSFLAEVLGLEVYFYDIVDKLAIGRARKCQTMEELLKISDIVTVHVDGRKSNENLIAEAQFKLMKKGAIFLNLSRGFVVDEAALAKYIKLKNLSVAIDVYQEEPEKNSDGFVSRLRNLPNTILTPHVGGNSEEAQKNIAEFVCDKARKFLQEGETGLCLSLPNLSTQSLLAGDCRIVHIHENRPGIMAGLNEIFKLHNINIDSQALKTNESVGYCLTDCKIENFQVMETLREILKNVPGTINVRIIKK